MSSKRGRKCSIKSCDNFQHTHKHLSFFRFPKDASRCRIWIEKTQRFDLLDKINVHDERICQQHFESAMFLNESQNRLQQHAMPTLYLTAKPPLSQMPLIDLSRGEHAFLNPKFNMDMVDAAAALLYQNNLTITPVYSSKPKPAKVSEPVWEPLNLSASNHNGLSLHHSIHEELHQNSIILNSSNSSSGSLNNSMQATTMTPTPIPMPRPRPTPTPIQIPTPTPTPIPTFVVPTIVAPINGTKITTNIQQQPAGGSRRPRQVFTVEQENELADYVRETSNYYSGLSSKEVRILAFVYGVCNQVEMPVGWRETHEASFDWCVGFLKRTKLPPSMVTSISTKASSKQSKTNNSISNLNPGINSNVNFIVPTVNKVNGNSLKKTGKIDNVTPIEID